MDNSVFGEDKIEEDFSHLMIEGIQKLERVYQLMKNQMAHILLILKTRRLRGQKYIAPKIEN